MTQVSQESINALLDGIATLSCMGRDYLIEIAMKAREVSAVDGGLESFSLAMAEIEAMALHSAREMSKHEETAIIRAAELA